MIVFAFNTPAGRYNIKWEHASLDAWRNLFSFPDLSSSLKLSLEVAFLATIVATDPGDVPRSGARPVPLPGRGRRELRDLPGDRLARDRPGVVAAHDVRERPGAAGVHHDPARPHHVLHRRSWRSRCGRASQGMDRSLEEAAGDLGADPRTTFFKVTLPIIMPGVIAGGLLAFALSIDDFVITNFVAGLQDDVPAVGVRRHPSGDPGAGERHGDAPVHVRHPHRAGAAVGVSSLRARGDEKRLAQDKARLAAAQTS